MCPPQVDVLLLVFDVIYSTAHFTNSHKNYFMKFSFSLRSVLSSIVINEVVSEKQFAGYSQLMLQQVSMLTQRNLQMFCSHDGTSPSQYKH
jgi:phage-related protein